MVNLDFWKLFESNEKKSVTSARMYLTTSFVSLSLLVSPVSATYRVKNSSKRFSKPRFLKSVFRDSKITLNYPRVIIL